MSFSCAALWGRIWKCHLISGNEAINLGEGSNHNYSRDREKAVLLEQLSLLRIGCCQMHVRKHTPVLNAVQ